MVVKNDYTVEQVARLVASRAVLGELTDYDIEAMHTDVGLVVDNAAVWWECDDETLGVWAFRNNMVDDGYREAGFSFEQFDGLTLHRFDDAEKLRPATRTEAARSFLAEITVGAGVGAIDVDGVVCYVA